MTRPDGAWVPDGRAAAIRSDCDASITALDGMPIDLYLLHAPDPRVPWATSIRALGRLVDEGLVRRIGVCNVNRRQLDEALDLAPIAAVQVPLSAYDDTADRSGVLARCTDLGLALLAHTPLGGVRRAARLDPTSAEAALAWLLTLSPSIVAIPGARRPETARSAARAATITLSAANRDHLSTTFGMAPDPVRREAARAAARHPEPGAQRPEVVVVMGIPGAGKSRLAEDYAARGFERLNRDERGGSLKALAAELDTRLTAGATRIVLDNTYLTRASRSYVLESARGHQARTTCVWLDVPLEQAQVNMVERLLARFDGLPTPEDLRAASRTEPWLLPPTSQMRTLRELEPPTADEGWDALSRVPFERDRPSRPGAPGVFVAASALSRPGWEGVWLGAEPAAPHLVFDWRPDGDTGVLSALVEDLRGRMAGTPVEAALCPHPAGPPICWCRPPLPGLLLAFARTHGLDVGNSTLIGATTTHRRLAATLGSRYVSAGE
jgi:predicted kinase